MRPLTRYLAAALVVTVAGALAAEWPSTHLDIVAVPATTGNVVREIVAHSTLQAAATVDVGAPITGEIQALEANELATVQAGDILARIDPAPFEQALREARATAAYLEELGEDATPARMAGARAAIRSAERDLDRTIIRSPVDGVVVVRNVSVGQIVTAGDSAPILYRIATDLHHLSVELDLPHSEAAALRPFSDVVLTVDGHEGFERHGRLLRATTTTVVDVDNPDLRLRPGTPVTAAIVLERRDNVLRVPNDALTFTPPDGSASVVDAGMIQPALNGSFGDGIFEVWRYQGGRLTPVAVRVGLSGDGWTEIESGLQAGDRVATGVVARRDSIASTISIP